MHPIRRRPHQVIVAAAIAVTGCLLVFAMSGAARGGVSMKAMTLHLTALVTKDRFVNLNNRGSREAVAFALQDSGGKAVGKINFPQCVFAGSFICSTANGGAISVKGVGSQLESFVTFAVFQDGTTGFGNGDLKKNEKVLATITLKVKPSDKANTPSFQKGKRFPAIVAKKQ